LFTCSRSLVRCRRHRAAALPEDVAEHLARGALGHLVDEEHLLRALVAGQPSLAVGDDVVLPIACPGSVTTKAFTASPECGCGTPTTTAWATAGWETITSSTSAGYTLNPDTMMRSFTRSTMKRKPSSSTTATSPVRSQPSAVSAPRVASGSFQ
jgi:hypothetical protein